jgi:hypothetical protein
MRAGGAIVIIKLDGERSGPEDAGPYTLVISGAPLGGTTVRLDCAVLEEGLEQVICEYARRVWSLK